MPAGPLVVVIKVAQDQDPTMPSKFWPPNEPDQVETVAARYLDYCPLQPRVSCAAVTKACVLLLVPTILIGLTLLGLR